MGKPNLRLNPKVEGAVNRKLLEKAVKFLLLIIPSLPEPKRKGRGRPRKWSWRVLLIMAILMALCKKTYAAYEAEMRTNKTLHELLGVKSLPSSSHVHRFVQSLTISYLREIIKAIAWKYYKMSADMFVDATGFTLRKTSTWFNLRIKRKISKKDHYKLHALCLEKWHLILDFRITKGSRHDGPPLRKMLKPIRKIGLFFADGAYSCRATIQMIVDRCGSPFIPFSKDVTGKSDGCMQWKIQFNFFKQVSSLWHNIYHQRSKVEAIFSAIKRKYGNSLRGKSRKSRNRELILRLIAYNLRQALHIEYARENNLPFWVRAK